MQQTENPMDNSLNYNERLGGKLDYIDTNNKEIQSQLLD